MLTKARLHQAISSSAIFAVRPSTAQKVVIKYPPQYDGELHVHVTPVDKDGWKIELNLARQGNETPSDAVRRLADEIQKGSF